MALITKEKDCEGECPKCESTDIDFIDSAFEDETESIYCKCVDCGCEFTQMYVIETTYYITEYEHEDDLNKRTLFDKG